MCISTRFPSVSPFSPPQGMDSPYTNGSYSAPYPPATPHYAALPQTRTYGCSGPSYSTDSTAPYRPPPPAPPWGCGTQDCPAEGCSLRRQQTAGYSPPQVRHRCAAFGLCTALRGLLCCPAEGEPAVHPLSGPNGFCVSTGSPCMLLLKLGIAPSCRGSEVVGCRAESRQQSQCWGSSQSCLARSSGAGSDAGVTAVPLSPQTPGMPVPQYPYGDHSPGANPQPRAQEEAWAPPAYGVQPQYAWPAAPAHGNPFLSESHPPWTGSGAASHPPAWDSKVR